MIDSIKHLTVSVLGRERANRLSSPFYDWRARIKSRSVLATLPPKGLLVNFGCGPNVLRGWLNLDLARGEGIDIVWDLRRRLPFANESCAALFGEHVIEHLSKADAENLLHECHRVLQLGGVLRVSTPDAGRFLRSYATDGQFLTDCRFTQSAETLMDRVNMMMREDGQHLWTYDSHSLLLGLKRAGFSEAVEQAFGKSLHPDMGQIDSEGRAFESLYVEGIK